MYKGEPTKGIDFYNLLCKSDEFNAELGKVTLAAGRLEVELIHFLRRKGVTESLVDCPLGALINIGKRNNLFDKNLIIILEQLKRQRNYLTHNIYALFTELIDETILPRENLIDTDVETYIEKAWQLTENLIAIGDSIKKEK